MKKILAFVLAIALISVMVCLPAFATDDSSIISPEKGNNQPDDPIPPSPSTGCVLSLAGAGVLALTGGGVFLLSAKKLRESR